MANCRMIQFQVDSLHTGLTKSKTYHTDGLKYTWTKNRVTKVWITFELGGDIGTFDEDAHYDYNHSNQSECTRSSKLVDITMQREGI